MTIIKSAPKIVSQVTVIDEDELYQRVVYSNGCTEWNSLAEDGDCDERALEEKYQELIKSMP